MLLFEMVYGTVPAPVVPADAPQVAPPAPADSGLPRFGKILLFGSILAQFSRLPELIILIVGFFPPLLVTGSGFGAAAIAAISGQMRLTASGILWLLFTGWFCLCTAFSTWPGGSAQAFIKFWLPSIVLNCTVCSLIQTGKDLRKVLYLTGLSSVIVAFAGWRMGTNMGEDRLAVAGASTLSNGNDMCLFLLAGLPCLVLLMELRKGFWRLAALACIPLVLYIVILTGSRAGALDLTALWVLWFWRASPMNKLKHLVVLGAAAFAIVTLAPTASLVRYATMLPFAAPAAASEHAAELGASAAASTEIRKKLITESFDLTARYPIFGVGPGVFQSASAKDAEARGENADWFVSHNSYTQVLSECGVPGFILYMAAVVLALNSLRRGLSASRRLPPNAEVSTLGFYLLMVTIGNMVLSTFASVAYMPYFIIFAGLGDAYLRIVNNELNFLSRPAPAPVFPAFRGLRRA